MNRIIIFFLCLCYVISASAEIMIFNKAKNNVTITYRFCGLDEKTHQQICSGDYTTSVDGKVSSLSKNYISITAPDDPTYTVIVVVSSIEKDDAGKIVSQGAYTTPSPMVNSCGYPFYVNSIDGKKLHLNSAIVLDDIDSSPVILCFTSSF